MRPSILGPSPGVRTLPGFVLRRPRVVLAVAVLLALPGGLFATLVGLDFRRITPVLIERMERWPIHFRGMRRGAVIAAVTTGIGSGSLPALVRLIPPRPAS